MNVGDIANIAAAYSKINLGTRAAIIMSVNPDGSIEVQLNGERLFFPYMLLTCETIVQQILTDGSHSVIGKRTD